MIVIITAVGDAKEARMIVVILVVISASSASPMLIDKR